MAQSKLAKKVAEALDKFCEHGGMGYIHTIFPENELHLQMSVGRYLEDECFLVLYEYHVPASCIKGSDNPEIYPWRNIDKRNNTNLPQEIYLDLVVYDADTKEYVPIEIKYKTRDLKDWKMGRYVLGEQMKKVNVLRNQGAQDQGMYGFWKDVRRVEMVQRSFPKAVKNGIALFVTNDPLYFQNMKDEDIISESKKDVDYFNFRMSENRHTKKGECMKWNKKGSKNANKYPAFNLEGEYTVNWNRFGYYDFELAPEADPDFYDKEPEFAEIVDLRSFKFALLNTSRKNWAFCYCMLII